QFITVSAAETLRAGLEVPKFSSDTEGYLYYDLPEALIWELSCIKYGRKASNYAPVPLGEPVLFREWAKPWVQAVGQSMKQGNLWEMGVLMQGADDRLGCISIGIP